MALTAIGVITVGLYRLEPAAPPVESATIYPDTVKRGEMVRQVRGIGKLEPEEVRWIPATSQRIVERILVEPGAVVEPNTILVELSNPELEQQTSNAELDVRAQEADLANLRVQLQSTLLNQRAGAASVEAEFERTTLQFEADTELNSEGLKSDLDLNLSRVQSRIAARRWELEQEALAIAGEANQAQIAAAITRLDQSKAAYALLQFQLGRLMVRAGTSGVLTQIPVEVGQQLSTGTNIARVSDPTRLKAESNIAETQARDIQVGQFVAVDTRNGIIPGTVTRIDPAVARALAGSPSILLADEPTENLDSKNGEAVMKLMENLHQEGATICMVTHDPRYSEYAERTVHLFDGAIVDESDAATK